MLALRGLCEKKNHYRNVDVVTLKARMVIERLRFQGFLSIKTDNSKAYF